jgi:hypothetical protein
MAVEWHIHGIHPGTPVMTTSSPWRVAYLWVPHLRDGFIVAKVGWQHFPRYAKKCSS